MRKAIRDHRDTGANETCGTAKDAGCDAGGTAACGVRPRTHHTVAVADACGSMPRISAAVSGYHENHLSLVLGSITLNF